MYLIDRQHLPVSSKFVPSIMSPVLVAQPPDLLNMSITDSDPNPESLFSARSLVKPGTICLAEDKRRSATRPQTRIS